MKQNSLMLTIVAFCCISTHFILSTHPLLPLPADPKLVAFYKQVLEPILYENMAIQLPSSEVLKARLRKQGHDHFLEKTGLHEKLGSKKLNSLGVLVAVELALHDYDKYCQNQFSKAYMDKEKLKIMWSLVAAHKPLRYILNGTIAQLDIKNDSGKAVIIKPISPAKHYTVLQPDQSFDASNAATQRNCFKDITKLFGKAYATQYMTIDIDNICYSVKFENRNISHGHCQALTLSISDIVNKGVPYQPKPDSPAYNR